MNIAVFLPNWVGDAVMATPALRALREHFAGAHLVGVLKPYVAGVLEGAPWLDSRRRLGQRVAFTNGCFDVLHAGHVQYLQEARAQADVLVVGLNSDAGVRALKGEGRPVNPLEARALVLAGLHAVDYVTVFEEATPLELIGQLRPDVLVKGADYRKDEVVGAELVESYGGRVYLSRLRPGFSTTGVLEKLHAA